MTLPIILRAQWLLPSFTLTLGWLFVFSFCRELENRCNKDSTTEATENKTKLLQMKKNAHPGFSVVFDNIDLDVNAKNMTLAKQNSSLHWVNHKFVINRISGLNRLQNKQPDLLDVSNQSFLPTATEMLNQQQDYVVLVSRVLVEYFGAFRPFTDCVIHHIPHKYTKEMSTKSTKVYVII